MYPYQNLLENLDLFPYQKYQIVKERRNPQKIVKIGKVFVARVYNIDDQSMITLSRRRPRKDDILACEQRFKDALTMLKIVENMSQYTQLTVMIVML